MTVIPDGEILFRYAKPESFPDDQSEIPPGVFQDTELSCDWQKYRGNPQTSFHIMEGRSVIICIEVCDSIRNPENPKRSGQKVEAWKQEIIHDPVTIEDDPIHGANEAHSLIRGRKKKAVLDALIENSNFYK